MKVLRMKRHTFKIILLTSFTWLIMDLVMLLLYSDCFGEDCSEDKRTSPEQSTSSNGLTQPHNTTASSPQRNQYPRLQLKEWKQKEPVQPSSIHLPGEFGAPVTTPKDREAEKKEKFKINQFNLVVSDLISLNRSLKDVRLPECKTKKYPTLLPTTSIIIVFHNEAWTTLLRTLYSIINRSPLELIQEIILVDDFSTHTHLGLDLEQELLRLPLPVRLFRTTVRSGLIRARLLGASKAEGSVLTFLDSHVETTEGWLEPLLAEVAADRRRVVCPIIDVISDETFEYVSASDMTWGGFNWKLNFRWYRVPQRELTRRNGDRSLPLHTPTMAGGLFSIDREYFYWLGGYDEGMDIWGGENLEMSFRVWMCGGILLISTCSHVGHVFRKSTPYTFPGGTSKIVNHNNARLAEVWMDEWKEFYFSINPGARKAEKGDLSGRLKLRQELKCKSFRWYLENIYPESQMPLHYIHLGEVKTQTGNRCMDTMSRKAGQKVGMSGCHGLGGNQVFAVTKKLQIMSDDNCLDAASGSSPVRLVRCHGLGGNQAWVWNQGNGRITHSSSGKCLASLPGEENPILQNCDDIDEQRWNLGGKLNWDLKS